MKKTRIEISEQATLKRLIPLLDLKKASHKKTSAGNTMLKSEIALF